MDVYVIVVHRQSGRQYTLNRSYSLNPDGPALPTTGHVDSWEGWTSAHSPAWTDGIPTHEFTAYWMY